MSITNYFGKPNFDFKNKYKNSFELKNMVNKDNDTLCWGYIKYYEKGNGFREFYGNEIEFDFYEKGIHKAMIMDNTLNFIEKKINDNNIYFDIDQPHIHLKPIIEELYDNDEQIIDNQILINNQINSLRETVNLLKKQNDDYKDKFEKLEKDYQQLLTNWTTITNYMKRIDNI